MDETKDILLKMIEEQWSQARQSEDQRATITNYVLIAVTAIIGLLANAKLVKDTLPLTIFLVIVGLYGLTVSRKLYERFNLHVHRAGKMMRRLDELFPDAKIRELQKMADAEHNQEYPLFYRIRLNWLWTLLYVFIIIAGLVTTIIAQAN